MKKVLFITYYWPPSGKASLHWPLKMIKFLPSFGWKPSVITVDEDSFSHPDKSLLEEIDKNIIEIKTKSFEPFDIYRKFIGKKKDEPLIASETISKTNQSLSHKISVWIRMNLFVPDARVGWYSNSVKEGKNLLEKNRHDVIISIGPPHTSHLIGKSLSKKFNIPHVPVFIDPWTDIIYYKDFRRNKLAAAIDNKLEKSVMKNARKIIFVTETMKENYERKYSWIKGKTNILYWGFNEDDFDNISFVPKSEEEVIVHAGNIFDYQNPVNFWEHLRTEIGLGRNLKIKFIGTVSPNIRDTIKQKGLEKRTEYLGFLPYEKMLQELQAADYLMVCATEPRHLPGKLFEYLRTGKPIIAFGDKNEEVKRILKQANAGMMFGYDENPKEFFNRINSFKTDKEYIKKFDRKIIAKSLSDILSEATEQ